MVVNTSSKINKVILMFQEIITSSESTIAILQSRSMVIITSWISDTAPYNYKLMVMWIASETQEIISVSASMAIITKSSSIQTLTLIVNIPMALIIAFRIQEIVTDNKIINLIDKEWEAMRDSQDKFPVGKILTWVILTIKKEEIKDNNFYGHNTLLFKHIKVLRQDFPCRSILWIIFNRA